MKRSAPLHCRPVKRRNVARRNKEFLRAYGGEARLSWTHKQPCVISGGRTEIEAVHVRSGGVGRKADAKWTVPMNTVYHRQLHAQGRASFEAFFRVSLDALAEATERAWQTYAQEEAP